MNKADYVAAAGDGDGSHHCHARGCTKAIKPANFMCGKHWFMVPVRLRKIIWRLYRPGQEIDKEPTAEYLDAARKAIEAVKHIEADRAAAKLRQGELI